MAPPLHLYTLYLVLIPGLIVAVHSTLNIIHADLSDANLAKASAVLSPVELRTLVGYSDLGEANLGTLTQSILLGAIVYVYAMVIYFSLRIWRALRTLTAQAGLGARTRELNRELNLVLAVQALAPLVFEVIPSVIVNLGGATGIVPVGIGAQIFLIVVLNLQPVVNGVLTLLLIRPYRQAVMGVVCGFKPPPAAQAVVTTTSHHSQNSHIAR